MPTPSKISSLSNPDEGRLRSELADFQCQAGQMGGEDTELSDAVRRRCRSDAPDLGSHIGVARLVFDATVRRMKSSAR